MQCTQEELALRRRFADVYERSQDPVMLSIERRVCGCDYGGNSWTTQDQADELIARLRLRPGLRLLELGAGSGWPGLYFARESGCDAVLLDLPEVCLRIASQRAVRQNLSEHVSTVVADAADLPFPDAAFDAISHSDLLCCLVRKRCVLEACRRILRAGGRMAFTVISIAPGLSAGQRARAIANGPEFIEADIEYPSLLAQTGWAISDCEDLTAAYAASCERQICADEEHAQELEALIGPDEFSERLEGWRNKLVAIHDGLYKRELFVAVLDAR